MFINSLSAIASSFFCVFVVYAGENGAQRSTSGDIVSHADVLQWSLGLVTVLALFGFCVWLLRKTGHFSTQTKNQLAVLSGLSLGMREKVVLIKVGEKQLLLGVTPGRVDKLLELEGDARLFQNPTDKDENGLFAKKLQQILLSKVDG